MEGREIKGPKDTKIDDYSLTLLPERLHRVCFKKSQECVNASNRKF